MVYLEKWLICDEINQLTLDFLTYSWQWDQMCQLLLKKFFISLMDSFVTKWLICDKMNQLTLDFVTYSWQWDQMCQLLLKNFFYISYGLVCDEMTNLWRNEPINTKSCNLLVKLGSNVTTFCKEVFWYLLRIRRYRILQSLMV